MLIIMQSTTTLRSPIWSFGVEKPFRRISIISIATEASTTRYVPPSVPPTRHTLISCGLNFFRLGNRLCINSVGAMRTCTRSARRSSRARNVSTFSTTSGIRITSIRIVPPAIFGDKAGARATLTPRTTSVRTTNSDSSGRLGADYHHYYSLDYAGLSCLPKWDLLVGRQPPISTGS